jgi:hypothetical protein
MTPPPLFNAHQRWILGDAPELMVAGDAALAEASVKLHRDCWPAVYELAAAAREAGFELRIASGFRSFDRQLSIWNGKLDGSRELLDDDGVTLDYRQLSVAEQVAAVLRFSALPGASRHHWGSDFDVYDAASLTDDYRLQLAPHEYREGGVMAAFGAWLESQLAASLDGPLARLFDRPYSVDRGGVAIEPWHLSHRALAAELEPHCSEQLLADRLGHCAITHADYLAAELPALWRRYLQPHFIGGK